MDCLYITLKNQNFMMSNTILKFWILLNEAKSYSSFKFFKQIIHTFLYSTGLVFFWHSWNIILYLISLGCNALSSIEIFSKQEKNFSNCWLKYMTMHVYICINIEHACFSIITFLSIVPNGLTLSLISNFILLYVMSITEI